MKLKTKDQIHISNVQAENLRPGEEFEVSSAQGKELLKAHPDTFEVIEDTDEAEAPAEKAKPAPENKAIVAAPANKAKPKGK